MPAPNAVKAARALTAISEPTQVRSVALVEEQVFWTAGFEFNSEPYFQAWEFQKGFGGSNFQRAGQEPVSRPMQNVNCCWAKKI